MNIASRRRTQSLLLFFILLIAYAYFLPRWAEWNQNSRINLTRAIIEQGTLQIDDYYQNSGDYAHFEGHYYTDKAPGLSFLAVPVYALARPLLQSAPARQIMDRIANSKAFGDTLNDTGTGLLTDKIYSAAVIYVATFFTVSVPSAILGVLLFLFLIDIGTPPAWSSLIALIFGLCTNAFPYSGAFYGHQLVAFLLFGAFFIAFKIKREELSPRWAFLAGLALGYALITEYPAFLIAFAIFLYMLWTLYQRFKSNAWPWIALFIVGGIPPGLLMMSYDLAIFHTLLPVGYEYSELYLDLHSTGFLSLTYPHIEALVGITFSPERGLFYMSPVLLLAVVGFYYWWRSHRHRAEFILCLWATISFFLFNGSSVMWQGGFAIGPRYVIPMLPFLAAGLSGFVLRWGKFNLARVLTAVLAAWSLFVVWAETIGGQLYPAYQSNPLVEYSLPYISQGDIARNLGMIVGLKGLASIVPLLIVLVLAFLLLLYIERGRSSQSDYQTSMPASTAKAR